MDNLRSANSLKNNTIEIGEVLTIPKTVKLPLIQTQQNSSLQGDQNDLAADNIASREYLTYLPKRLAKEELKAAQIPKESVL